MIKADQNEKSDTQRRFQHQKSSEKHISNYFHFITEKKENKTLVVEMRQKCNTDHDFSQNKL